jgi:hypothetical protein
VPKRAGDHLSAQADIPDNSPRRERYNLSSVERVAPASYVSCVLVGIVVLVIASSCGGRSSHVEWVSCPRPPGGADVRQFRVKGGETCGHARRVLGYTAFGHEGGCGDACHYLGFICRDRPGGLKRNSSGGSYYTHVDDWCARGPRRAAWRIVFH